MFINCSHVLDKTPEAVFLSGQCVDCLGFAQNSKTCFLV